MVEEKEQLLDSVFGLSKKLGKIPFPTVVKKSTGFNVIPINIHNSSDKMLIDTLNKIFKDFLKTSTSTRSRYQGDRINEVGRRIEDALVHEMNKQPLTVKKMPKTRVSHIGMKCPAQSNLPLGIFTILIQEKLKQMQNIFFWIYQFHKKVRDIGR